MTPLREVHDAHTHGGKASQLGRALRAGLPVPDGFALSHAEAHALAETEADRAEGTLASMLAGIDGPVAVRSSAVDEDGRDASFAGVHVSCLGVSGPRAVHEAVRACVASASGPGARAYRLRLGLGEEARCAVIVQRMVDARAAGVLFTRDPLGGADLRVVEASWGLGEAVVSGLVAPDRFWIDRGGTVVRAALGDKDVEIVRSATGVGERGVPEARRRVACLDAPALAALSDLATRVEGAFPDARAHDVEFAVDDRGQVHLLQRREVTR
jgi:pyruvate,water dikinase